MSFDLSSALSFEPPGLVVLTGPGDAVRWARTIPDFGSVEEFYALFLDRRRALQRAVWLPSEVSFDELADWPDLVVGYAPDWDVAEVMILAARPGQGVEPTLAEAETWDVMRLAHDARGVPLSDIVLVDGAAWHSLAETLA